MTEISYISLTKKMGLGVGDNDFKAMAGSFAWVRMTQNRLKIEVDWSRTKDICPQAVHYRQAHECLRDDVAKWCYDHCTNLYYVQRDPIVAYFMSPRDAVACKLHFHNSTLTGTI